MVIRWLGFLVLLVPAGVGVLFALMFAGFSVMGFDAPGSDRQLWPYLLVAGAWMILPVCAFLVVFGVVSMVARRFGTAYLCLVPPAALASAFLAWIRLS